MIHIVTGGSASGKSVWAEQQLLAYGENCRRFYVAAMKPSDDEMHKKILRHQQMRSLKRFTTIECYTGLENILLPPQEPGAPLAVLVECMSNLTANEMYDIGGTEPEVLKRIMTGIDHLKTLAEYLVIVTNEVFSDGGSYTEETRRYLRLLGKVNRELGEQAQQVTEVVYGIPIRIKAEQERRDGA